MMMLFQETGSTDVLYMQLDLASLKSVRCFTETFLKSESRLDLLINNAGTQTHNMTQHDTRGPLQNKTRMSNMRLCVSCRSGG